jgi:YgiT-type zinc finger domain-containing protein
MKRCELCRSTDLQDGFVQEVFNIDGKLVLIERIPARVCPHCGEETFSRETTETVRRLVHGEVEPVRSVSLDVFSYPQAQVA